MLRWTLEEDEWGLHVLGKISWNGGYKSDFLRLFMLEKESVQTRGDGGEGMGERNQGRHRAEHRACHDPDVMT